jgi:hypothetical protein
MKNNQTISNRGGRRPGAGRPAGVPNKIAVDLREMILGALSAACGQSYLAEQAQKNPAAFLTLLGKVLHRDVSYDELVATDAAETGAPALTASTVNDWKTRH